MKDKIEIFQKYDAFGKISQRIAASKLQISQPLLCKLLKNRSEIEEGWARNGNSLRKRNRHGKDEDVETALLDWFTQVRQKDARVNGPLLRDKAEELARKLGKENFVATEGWFHRWTKRMNVVYKKPQGEQRDADVSAVDSWLATQWPELSSEYSPDDIFNADETGLYYRALPETTYAFQNENTKGCKTVKDRITVLCCASMSGKKEKLLVIGKSKNPRCFKNVKNVPVDYHANANAWMTSTIFNEWLKKWDKRLTRNILLLIDNCPAHIIEGTLKRIRIVFLPANTTSLLQPLDQGIIRTHKAYYRKEMRRLIIQDLDRMLDERTAAEICKKLDLLSAIHFLVQAWRQVTVKTIENCFRKGGFIIQNCGTILENDIENDLVPDDMTASEFETWMAIDENLETSGPLTEDDVCSRILQNNAEEVDENLSEDDEVEIQPPSNKEVNEALSVLRRAIQCRANTSEFQLHYDYEKLVRNLVIQNCKQSEITQYFK